MYTTKERSGGAQPTTICKKMGLIWEEAEVEALDGHGWRWTVSQYVQLDAG